MSETMFDVTGRKNRDSAGKAGRWKLRILAAAITAALSGGAVTAWAQQEVKATGRVPVQSESAYAADLWRWNQVSLIKSIVKSSATKTATARGDVASLWRAQEIRVTWSDITKTRADLRKNSEEYVKGVTAYLDSIANLIVAVPKGQPMKEVADGFWAADQVNFIFSDLGTHLLSRIEYNGASERDREELMPIAKLAVRICDVASDSLLAIMEAEGEKTPFNDSLEGPYQRAFDIQALPQYYRHFAQYYMALALDPEKDAAARKEILGKAIKGLTDDWIDGEDAMEKGVKSQALLLRAKCNSEMGKYADALRDFQASQDPKNAKDGKVLPETAFQAKYQTVVTRARNKDFEGARRALEDFRTNSPLKPSTPAEIKQAEVAMDMLGFRVSWMEAEAKPEAERQAARLGAIKPLGEMISKVPDELRSWVYEALIAQVSAKDEAAALSGAGQSNVLPLQALAMSWNRMQQGKVAEGAKKIQLLGDATKLADFVRKSKTASAGEKLEATAVAVAVAMEKDEHETAARLCVDYAEMAPPDDKKLKNIAAIAVEQLTEVRKKNKNELPPEMQTLAQRLVQIQADKLKDPRWEFAKGITLVKQYEAKHDVKLLAAANEAFRKVPKDDPNHLQSLFQRLKVAGLQLAMMQKDPTASKNAARDMLDSCRDFRRTIDELSKNPGNVNKESIEQAKERLTDVTLWEISVSIDPLQDAANAMRRIKELEDAKVPLSDDQQASILQYRIKAFMIQNRGDDAVAAALDFTNRYPEKGTAIIQQLVFKWQDEVATAERADRKEKAQLLASQLVKLLQSLITATENKPAADPKAQEAKKTQIYKYKQFQGQMMVTGGQYDQAIDLFAALDREKREDAYNNLWTAHALYGKGKIEEAQKRYRDLIDRLRPRSAPWWECYLRLIQANEVLAKSASEAEKEAIRSKNRKALVDLKVLYGKEDLGGEEFHEAYVDLLRSYGVE